MQILSEEQVRRNLEIDELVLALERMFRRNYEATAIVPLRTRIKAFDGTTCLVMPCSDSSLHAAGLKVVTVQDGPKVNGDRTQAHCLLLEQTTGKVCAVISANYITEMRTAAVSAIATKFLARQDAKTLGIFGTGRQAISHLLVLTHIYGYERILVCGSSPSRSEVFAEAASRAHRLAVEPVDSQTCARESNVICTCTNSKTPLFDGSHIRGGTHLNLVGGYQPDVREVDDFVISRARIVVDTHQAALEEAGDLLIPLRSKAIHEKQIIGDLHAIVSGKVRGRTQAGDITLFKSVGFALEDLVGATLVYERFLKQAAVVQTR
jgi:ornithine cyclodeaminase/alanine dehydrogenase-like protein (mu-crystallin family)